MNGDDFMYDEYNRNFEEVYPNTATTWGASERLIEDLSIGHCFNILNLIHRSAPIQYLIEMRELETKFAGSLQKDVIILTSGTFSNWVKRKYKCYGALRDKIGADLFVELEKLTFKGVDISTNLL